MSTKVVIFLLSLLCLQGMGQSAAMTTDSTAEFTREAAVCSYYVSDNGGCVSEFAAIICNYASSNVSLHESDKHKQCKSQMQLHDLSLCGLYSFAFKSFRHSRPISCMGQLRHLIFLEKIMI